MALRLGGPHCLEDIEKSKNQETAGPWEVFLPRKTKNKLGRLKSIFAISFGHLWDTPPDPSDLSDLSDLPDLSQGAEIRDQ